MEVKDKIKRINEIMTYFNLNQTKFAQKIDTTQQVISDILNGKRNIGKGIEARILSTFNINKGWWKTGEGSMFGNDGECQACIAKDRQIVQLELTIKTLQENNNLLREKIENLKKGNGDAKISVKECAAG